MLLQWLVFERVVRPARRRRLGPRGRGRRGGAGTDPAQRPDHVRGLAASPTWAGSPGWPDDADDALGHGRRSVAAVPPEGHSWFGATANAMLATHAAGHRRRAATAPRPSACCGPVSPRPTARARRRTGCAASRRWPRRPGRSTSCCTPTGCWRRAAARRARVGPGGTDAYVSLGRAWLAAGRRGPGRPRARRLVAAGERTGWDAVVRAAARPSCSPRPRVRRAAEPPAATGRRLRRGRRAAPRPGRRRPPAPAGSRRCGRSRRPSRPASSSGAGRVVVDQPPGAVPVEPVPYVELLLEVVPQRDVEERPPVRGQLHRRGEPALHDGEVAHRQVPPQVVHVRAHLEPVPGRARRRPAAPERAGRSAGR